MFEFGVSYEFTDEVPVCDWLEGCFLGGFSRFFFFFLLQCVTYVSAYCALGTHTYAFFKPF